MPDLHKVQSYSYTGLRQLLVFLVITATDQEFVVITIVIIVLSIVSK